MSAYLSEEEKEYWEEYQNFKPRVILDFAVEDTDDILFQLEQYAKVEYKSKESKIKFRKWLIESLKFMMTEAGMTD